MNAQSQRPNSNTLRVLFVSSGNSKNFDISPFIKEQGESLKKWGAEVDYFPVRGKGLLGYSKSAFDLRKYLKDKKFDVIHGHFVLSGYVSVLGSRGTPVVLSLMGSDAYGQYVGENKVIFLSRFLSVLTWIIQPFVKAIISKSANIEKYVYRKGISHIIPNGIDIEKFKPDKNYAQELGLDPAKKQVLFLGSKSSVRKNLPLVQNALSLLNRNDVELINPYPISHKMIPKYLNSAHVLAVCSYMEGSPNVVKEAMACNCPMVATDVGDINWVLGKTEGCYTASFKAEDFAEKLRHALEFSESKGRTRGMEQVEAVGLDSASIAKKVIEVYKLALKK